VGSAPRALYVHRKGDPVARSNFPGWPRDFTDAEKEVLEMLVAGRSNKEIGAALGIAERTVKAHVAS